MNNGEERDRVSESENTAEKKSKKKLSKKQKTAVIAASVIAAVILVIFLTAFLVLNSYLNKINKIGTDIEVVPPSEENFDTDGADILTDPDLENLNPSDVYWPELEPLMDDDLINILLVGQDRLEGQGRQRSDSMILCSINPDTMEVSMISFLRDLYVDFPGDYSDNRLNAAYAFGGFPMLVETLNMNFGVSIDGCFEVDFYGFMDIINMLGGVDIELTEAEARYLDNGTVAGMNHLNGLDALAYARIRFIDSDFYRTGRQRTVLTAVFNKIKGLSTTELLDLADEILPYLSTTMTNSQIMGLIIKFAPKLSSVELSNYHVPPSDGYQSANINGMAVLVPDLVRIRDYLKNECLPLD